jgi:sterol 14alpha-demethylase
MIVGPPHPHAKLCGDWLIGGVFSLHILLLMNGGHTNQANTFTWSLLHAIRSPELLDSLRKQTTPDLLEATLRETGRMYTNLLLLRRITISQQIMGHDIPAGSFIGASPLVTARDPTLFDNPDSFRPDRWLTPSHTLDDAAIKSAQRTGSSTQFGKGQHYCLGEKLAKMLIGMYWEIVLGDEENAGFDIEIVGGVVQGRGVDGVGVEGAWTEENIGTPFEKGGPLMVRFHERER